MKKEHGGTGRGVADSFEMLNPMYGFTGKDTMEKGEQFVNFLNENEKEKLKIAQRYYEDEIMLPEMLMQKLRKKDITNQEAKTLLSSYINSKISK